LKRGAVWRAELGAHRPQEQMSDRPAIIGQCDAVTRVLHSELELATDEALGRVEPGTTAP